MDLRLLRANSARIIADGEAPLLCRDWSAVRPALEAAEKALGHGLIIEAEQQARHKRIESLRAEVEADADEAPGLDAVGCAEHRALAEEIRARIAQARER